MHVFESRPGIDGYMVLSTAEYLKKNLIHSDIVLFYRICNYHLHEPVIQTEETASEDFETIFREIMNEYAK